MNKIQKKAWDMGAVAPDFTLSDSDGIKVRLSSFQGRQPVVLVFYPGDMTPGCTKQLCSIRDDYAGFQKLNAQVLGVNHADADSHNKFIKKYKFQFPILIDTGRKVSKMYGALKYMFGNESIKRSVVVIGIDGRIKKVWRGMPGDNEIIAELN